MRMAAFGLVALFLLAGCSGGGGAKKDSGTPFEGLDLQTSATTGILRGIVVDDAIRPIAGASVYLTPASPPLQTKSNEQGAFAFSSLQPGTYFVQVQKAGFAMAQQSNDVVAGVAEPPIVKVQLMRDASFVPPYVETFVLDGFMECSAGFVDNLGDFAVENACSESPGGVKPFSNDNTFVQYQLSGKPKWVQSEMVWQSTQAASKSMNLNIAVPESDPTGDGWDDHSVDGQSPLLNTLDEKSAEHYVLNGTLSLRIFPWADQAPGVVLAVEQKFTVYTHVFYGYVPPADWRFSSGEPVPAPPL